MKSFVFANLAAFIVLLCNLPLAQSAPPLYQLTDLGTLGGPISHAAAINSMGQVVGTSNMADNASSHAFLYSGGSMIDLGTLGGTNSSATGINDAAQITGTADTAGAFLYSNGSMKALSASVISPNVTLGNPSGINSSGEIVGSAQFQVGGGVLNHAFLYSAGVVTDLGSLDPTHGGRSTAYAINTAGQVVGSSSIQNDALNGRTFLYSNGTMIDPLGQSDLGGLAYSINASGQIVGALLTAFDASTAHAFLYSNGTTTDLGTLGGTSSVAYGINDSGQIVGGSYLAGDATGDAFLYTGGKMYDLDSLLDPTAARWHIDEVQDAINDKGWIAANGDFNGQNHAVLLTPIVPGDFDRDGKVTLADVQAMMSALSDLGNYESTQHLTDIELRFIGDINGDGVVNNLDVQAEIALVANAESVIGSISTVPEPASICLMAFGALAMIGTLHK